MKSTNAHGGARKGAGRKKATVKKVTLSFKVPERNALLLKVKIKALIEKIVKS